ncbi:sensor histidine kinase [Hamadaea tsunoensis]|uniref:ATP-binding protein n=1 Tax=Hamadaea tsunoensis TaxID=53368 RepID=UPI001FE1A2E6|nr:ATP-binding protein [Hamadaea tsunoensis]
MVGRNARWRVADLPTTKVGVERVFTYFIAGVRLGTIAQMVPAVRVGAAAAPHHVAYLACWLAAASASIAVSVVTLARRRPVGAAAATADFALACLLLVFAPYVVLPGARFGTWVAFEPGYALSVIITASGVRSLVLWAGGLVGVVVCYAVYLGNVATGMVTTAMGNELTFVVYAVVARMLFNYIRRIAHDADASRALAAELARREEERRARVLMHNGVAIMQLLAHPGLGGSQSGLVDQAEVELQRMRAYLRGATSPEAASREGPDEGGGQLRLAELVARVCDRFADLRIDPLLDLGKAVRVPVEEATAVERALESLLLNVRAYAKAENVVVHLDQDGGGVWALTVSDDGVGFDPASVALGVGLRDVVVGELGQRGLGVVITSAPGEGTTVTISRRIPPPGRRDGLGLVADAR